MILNSSLYLFCNIKISDKIFSKERCNSDVKGEDLLYKLINSLMIMESVMLTIIAMFICKVMMTLYVMTN